MEANEGEYTTAAGANVRAGRMEAEEGAGGMEPGRELGGGGGDKDMEVIKKAKVEAETEKGSGTEAVSNV